MKYFLKKLLGHEKVKSRVSWATNFFWKIYKTLRLPSYILNVQSIKQNFFWRIKKNFLEGESKTLIISLYPYEFFWQFRYKLVKKALNACNGAFHNCTKNIFWKFYGNVSGISVGCNEEKSYDCLCDLLDNFKKALWSFKVENFESFDSVLRFSYCG